MSFCYYCMADTMREGRCTVCGRQRGVRKPDSIALPPGTQLDEGSITLGETIGEGGFGITYIAKDELENRVICVKEFRPKNMILPLRQGNSLCPLEDYDEPYAHALRSFIREARILDALKAHPNIVRAFFYLEENRTAYYGMELLNGVNLRQWLKARGKPLSPKDACTLLNPVMDALAFCHSYSAYEKDNVVYLDAKHQSQETKGIIHRDISPNNIFLCDLDEKDEPKNIKLIDFGAALATVDGITQSYENVQCKGYSPLEQLQYGKEAQGPWADVYAFSATMYYCLTLQVPPSSMLVYQGSERIKPPSELGIRIPKRVEKVLMAGLTLRYDERIQNMGDFQKQFCDACRVSAYHFTPQSPAPPPPPPPPSPVLDPSSMNPMVSFPIQNTYPVQPLVRPVDMLYCIAGTNRGNCWELGQQLVIGRNSKYSQLVIADSKVSRQHCVIEKYNGRYVLMDLQSSNGTFLKNQLLPPKQGVYLSDGDEFRIGDHYFKVRITS